MFLCRDHLDGGLCWSLIVSSCREVKFDVLWLCDFSLGSVGANRFWKRRRVVQDFYWSLAPLISALGSELSGLDFQLHTKHLRQSSPSHDGSGYDVDELSTGDKNNPRKQNWKSATQDAKLMRAFSRLLLTHKPLRRDMLASRDCTAKAIATTILCDT
jgi:hypothetical protein